MASKTITLAQWLDMLPSPRAIYKDCLILDAHLISERYVLLTLKVPQPVGGIYNEIVSVETLIEIEEGK